MAIPLPRLCSMFAHTRVVHANDLRLFARLRASMKSGVSSFFLSAAARPATPRASRCDIFSCPILIKFGRSDISRSLVPQVKLHHPSRCRSPSFWRILKCLFSRGNIETGEISARSLQFDDFRVICFSVAGCWWLPCWCLLQVLDATSASNVAGGHPSSVTNLHIFVSIFAQFFTP